MRISRSLPGESQPAIKSGYVGKPTGHDIVLNIGNLWQAQVVSKQINKLRADHREQKTLVHNPTAEDDPVWCQHQTNRHSTQGTIVCFKRPCWMVGRKPVSFYPPPCLNRRTVSQPLQTGSVEGADAPKILVRMMQREQHVPHLRMRVAMKKIAVNQGTSADSRPDRKVNQVG